MDLREILRIQLDYWHGMLQQVLDGYGADVLQRAQGTVPSIAAIYAHAVIWGGHGRPHEAAGRPAGLHFIEHAGEIAAIKGVQGLHGLPY